MLLAHVSTGGVVSTSVTVWLKRLLNPQLLVNSHVRVMFCGHRPFVIVPRTTGLVSRPLHELATVGTSNDQATPHSTVLLVEPVSNAGLFLPAEPAA